MPSQPRHQSPPPPDFRSRTLLLAVVAVWVLLAGRLIHLQWTGGDDLADRADRQRSFVETIAPRPGEILDRNGRLLATTITTKSLFVVPSRLDNAWPVARKLADALHLDPDALFEQLSKHRGRHFLWIKRRLSDDEVARLRDLSLPTSSWGLRDEYLRRYPQGALAAHILGLRDIDGKGRGGIEQSHEHLLAGREGSRQLVRDAHGRVIDVREDSEQAPQHGRSVVLTIDSVVQLYAERALDTLMTNWHPHTASAIVLDPKTGEVLAMASRPTFDPNRPEAIPDAAWKNHAIAAMYEPGSTFKPFVVGWAMEIGRLAADEIFNCENGEYRMGRRILHDHHRYGSLSLADVLVKSSNIGMAKIGERIGNRELYNAAVAFGFGSRTGIELPGELSGMLRPLDDWNSYSTGSVPMGQELAVTPVQLVAAHAALANGGALITPRLVLGESNRLLASREESDDRPGLVVDNVALTRSRQPANSAAPELSGSAVVSQTIRPEITRWLVTGPMTDVVTRGTGRKGNVDGYVVFGKTGTAQKPDPAAGGYSETRHVCSFLCGAPADDPRILVLVVADEPTTGPLPYFGGTVAAPAAADILHHTLIHLRVPAGRPPLRAAMQESEADSL